MSPVADALWYASYGSNMLERRFQHYLHGGRPAGARREYPGARDRSAHGGSVPVTLAGSVFFAWESPTWGGGIAFYDPDGPGTSYGRAYLVTAGQFSDIFAQEMHRIPEADLDVTGLLADGRFVVGPGRYEHQVVVGEIDGVPVVTFTASWTADEIAFNAPAERYVAMLVEGLRESHGVDDTACVDYLLGRPGIGVDWTRARLVDLVARTGSADRPRHDASRRR